MTEMRKNKENAIQRKRFTFFDGAIIVGFVLSAVFFAMYANTASSEGLEVVVKKDSEVICTEKLSKAYDSREICIDEEFNIILMLEPDGVYVVNSDCDDKVCVNTGKITKSGQAIVCLPAHISVELRGENSSTLDGVVG